MNIIKYLRVFFREVNTGYLALPTCHKTCPVHTVALDLEDPLASNVPGSRRHKTIASHVPYLLLVHVGKLLVNCFLPFCARVGIGMILSFVEIFGFFRYRLGVIGYHSQIDMKI